MDILETLNVEELDYIDELKGRMKSVMPKNMHEDTHMYYRFLKACEWRIGQAESMLRKHLDFRNIYDIENILTYRPPEVLKKHCSWDFLGFDKEGNLVGFWAIGNLDGRGIMKSANKYDILRFTLNQIERDRREQKYIFEKMGIHSKQCVYIEDCKNLSLSTVTDMPTLELFKGFVTMLLDNYPESIKTMYFINAPAYFAWAYAVVEMILPGAFKQKLRIFTKDGWKEELLKIIDADVLPVALGGTKTDPDGNHACRTLLNYPNPILEEHFLTKNIKAFSNRCDVEKATVGRSSTFFVEFDVSEPKTTLEVEFQTKHHDIGFMVEMKKKCDDYSDSTVMIPLHRYETEYYPMKRTICCKKSGKYSITFDNRHSWFHSKEIYYRVQLKNPYGENANVFLGRKS